MTYKNTKTGQVVKTTGKVFGGDWVLVQDKTAATPKAPAKPKGERK